MTRKNDLQKVIIGSRIQVTVECLLCGPVLLHALFLLHIVFEKLSSTQFYN